jgi:type VI secretion system FHA domain protein
VDPLNLLGFGAKPAPRPSPRAADLAGSSPLSDHYTPPQQISVPPAAAPPAHSPLIPDDYNPLGADTFGGQPLSRGPAPAGRSEPPPRRVTPPPAPAAPEPPRVPAAPAAHKSAPSESPGHRGSPELPSGRTVEGDLAAVLAGAGLENVAVTPELARSFGRILRVVVGGVMDILQSRQRIKSEFRMGMTTFKPADNNPLKFSANVDDALHNLLVKRNAAYLGPVDAFEDAFDDLRNHQVAMLAGMRVAFEAMLAEFEPDRLQEEFDRQSKKGALLAAPAKLRYWDLYREKFHDMVKDPESSFRELFGDEFAKAYEEQLRRLKAQGRPVKS